MIWKKEPANNWLVGLDAHRRLDKPSKHPHYGPWYSDDGEDGVINYLFDFINDEFKHAVDLGSYHGYGGSQIRHVADKYSWNTTEFDSAINEPMHPNVRQVLITPETICSKLDEHNTPKEFDLLSLDIDSVDYNVLESILNGGFKPNVAIVEFNPLFAHDELYVRSLDPPLRKNGTSWYGASLGAFENLMNNNNYTLIHVFGKVDVDTNGNTIPENSLEINNALFINNKFITKDTIISSIDKLHPTPWIESHKKHNPEFGDDYYDYKSFMINSTEFRGKQYENTLFKKLDK
tara:strand:+ start:325 stop:1197 length:873 start_codon:yes stop_codon:yes gene_type:complete